jgi:DNA-binding XRE family transcriptional regulator
MKTRHTENNTEIMLTIPSNVAEDISGIILRVLKLAGHKVRQVNDESDELLTIEEVFPEGHPGMVLQGFRLRDEMTQTELAEKLGISQNRISDMENGKRSITKNTAMMLANLFDTSYKVFI